MYESLSGLYLPERKKDSFWMWAINRTIEDHSNKRARA